MGPRGKIKFIPVLGRYTMKTWWSEGASPHIF